MRNKILEEVIDEVIEKSDQPENFKKALNSYIKNKFDGNANDKDLQDVLNLVKAEEEK